MDADEELLEENTNYMDAYFLGTVSGRAKCPEGVDLAELRPEYEKAHKSSQDYQFRHPLVMTAVTVQSRLPLRVLHKSCNKDYAIYCIHIISSFDLYQVFRRVYDKWFVPNECYIAYGSFVAQLIGCWEEGSPKRVDSVLQIHAELCTQVRRRCRKVLDGVDLLDPSSNPARCHGMFELLPTFATAVIVIDTEDWAKDGVLFVRTLDPGGLERWPVSKGERRPEGTRLGVEEAVGIVSQMQRDIETSDEKARRLAPVLYRNFPGFE
jgi:hypothetical protein